MTTPSYLDNALLVDNIGLPSWKNTEKVTGNPPVLPHFIAFIRQQRKRQVVFLCEGLHSNSRLSRVGLQRHTKDNVQSNKLHHETDLVRLGRISRYSDHHRSEVSEGGERISERACLPKHHRQAFTTGQKV